jgi:methionyl-tRNA formyltransferase
MKKYRTIFIGSGRFAVPSLKAIIDCPFLKLESVVTAPDKPTGRKQELTPSSVKQFALSTGAEILQPKKIAELETKISQSQPDLIIVCAYGQIIPKKILDIPKFGSINLHPSLLPKYRGPSPIQTAILNGDKKTGITIMLMDEQMDHGPIIGQKETKISSQETGQSLEEKLSRLAADFLLEILPRYLAGEIKSQAQDESQANYTKILKRQDGEINWQKSSQEIGQMVRAFYPWPGAWTILNGKRLKIIKGKAAKEKTPQTLAAGKDYFLPEIVQPEGKKPMPWQDYLRGKRKI